MLAKLRWAPVAAALGLAGCAHSNPAGRVADAARLTAERLGQAPAWSEPIQEAPPEWSADTLLTLDQAVASALRNNRALRAELEMIGQADAELLQAGLLQNPMLNLMVMFPDGGGRAMLRGSGVPIQPLQDLWLIPVRKEVAAAELQQAVLRVADRAIETAASVSSTYRRLQYTQRAIALVKSNMELAGQSTSVIEARHVAGQSTQAAVNLARVREYRLRAELRAVEAEYRELQRELLEMAGLAGGPDGWAVAPIHEMTDELQSAGTEDELVALGAGNRLDLKAAEWSVTAAERRIALMRREGWPDVALGVTFERAAAPRGPRGLTPGARLGNASAQAVANQVYGTAGAPMAPNLSPWEPRLREMNWTVGPMLELEVPIFDQNQAQVAKAIHEYNQKRAEHEARRQVITRDIRAAWVKHELAREQVEFYRTVLLPDVEANLGLAQEGYVSAREDLTVFLQAQEDLITTRQTILEFLRDYYLSAVELQRAVGGRMPAADAPESPR